MGERGTHRDPGTRLIRCDLQSQLQLQSAIRSAICNLKSAIQATLDPLLSVLLASPCAACGELLEHPTQGPVCESCWQSILPLTPPVCDRCGDPLPTWRAISIPLARCPRCRRGNRHVDRARAVGAYDGALRAIVHALKYEGRRSLARPLAYLMRIRGADMLAGADWVVPVPLHPSRRRERGFNQAADLARHLGVPVRQALRRHRATRTQTGLPAARRHRNVRGAFALALRWQGSACGYAARTVREAVGDASASVRAGRGAPAPVKESELEGSIVVLIDDVSTTGATLDACARVLKAAGVREVRALTAARVVTLPR
jgi:predicted amidophosphoribosyltransferase